MSEHPILIIDDEKDICHLLSIALRKKKFTVYSANSIKDGLVLIDSFYPEYLFLDVNLPDGCGLSLISPIRIKYPKTGIIVISAYVNQKDKIIALQNGADIYVNKPFDNSTIYESINHISSKYGGTSINESSN